MTEPRHELHELNADRITELLTELGQKLTARGIDAELYVIGGAAMALAYDRERLTVDIDAIYVPKRLRG